MHIHILGICGTFMGSLAVLAKELGHRVTGSDANVYPPMSTQLEAQGIDLMQGYLTEHLDPQPDMVIIGNAMSRGNPAVEYVLNQSIPYTSGPQWLAEHVLFDKHVLALSGTHGKTTTSSMLACVLQSAGIETGYLIGGVPKNFDASARIGSAPYFVVEADEYDSAFFDKRSKFVHYKPRTLVINNLEFDHADIFDDLKAIQRQFHHVVRTVPSEGAVIYPQGVSAIDEVIEQGCWSPEVSLAYEKNSQATYVAELVKEDGSEYHVVHNDNGTRTVLGTVNWDFIGLHNVQNGLSAFAAALQVGLTPQQAIDGLNAFEGVKRRLEKIADVGGISVYDDFAHHPTAIASTLAGLRASTDGVLRIVLEPRSNTMQLGIHKDELLDSVALADAVYWMQPAHMSWRVSDIVADHAASQVFERIDDIVNQLCADSQTGDLIVIMSNGGFGGIHQLLVDGLGSAHG
ncbi:MAG: UDP-N-acetylmuramate:L-alanyl-gamma-D-glutamyl-meso-diaminopimelate ligase [Pseudomonadota bacterium]